MARNLLREEGVAFISIDDGELPGLRAIANDIFGEENSRLAEALIESKNLDLRDFLFKGDGRGTLNLKI